MKLEAICRVSVSDLSLQVRRQVDNIDSSKRTFLGTNTTSYTKPLRDECDSRLWLNFDTELASTHNWARLFAFLTTFLWLALVTVDNGNTESINVSIRTSAYKVILTG